MEITYTTMLAQVDWREMKSTLSADQFDNGRTPDQLHRSFENSFVAVVAYHQGKIIGTARVLSDGVCNAYIVDVWTLTAYRRRGIATRMMEILLENLPGQHVYLFTDEAEGLYRSLGFEPQSIGMGRVVGEWLKGGANG